MTSQLRSLRVLLVLSLLLLVGVGVALWFHPESIESRLARGDADAGGNFELQSAQGPVRLIDYQGNVVVLYFGYTSCPDLCPAALAKLGVAFRRLPTKLQQQTRGIFISVDPERDSLKKLAQYTQIFSDRIIGVTGSIEQIRYVTDRYGAYFHKVKLDSSNDYVMEHTAKFYLIDPHGQLVDILPQTVSSTVIDTRVRQLLGQ